MTKRSKFLYTTLIIPIAMLGLIYPVVLNAETNDSKTPEELKEAIEDQSKKLKQLQEKRKELKQKVEDLNSTQDTLQKEINYINYRINKLQNSIERNKTAIKKLNLEIKSLESDIEKTKKEMKDTKNKMASLLVKLQQLDKENPLTIILKYEKLTDSISKIEAILKLNESLGKNLKELTDLRKEYKQKKVKLEKKKEERKQQKENLTNRQSIITSQKQDKKQILAQTEKQEKSYQQKIEELNERQKEISKRIAKIEKRLRETFDPNRLPTKRPGAISFPTEDPLLTQCYGGTEFAEKSYEDQSHNGADFQADIGTPIKAVKEGTVKRVDNNDKGPYRWQQYQYGKYIVVEHDNNLSTLYGHLSKQTVTEGQEVEEGEVIGYSGNTGYSTGPHLHLGMYWTPSLQYKKFEPVAGLVPVGITVNPVDYLPLASNVENCK